MEIIATSSMRMDRRLLVIMHLTQLFHYVPGFGGFIVPMILWLSCRDTVIGMDEHGKSILNFQLSMLLYIILSIPAILLLGLGILSLIGVGILGFVLPIANAVRASHGEPPSYFLTIPFLR